MFYSTYLDHLAEEVNDKLQVGGLISVAELCKSYDLPGDFLSEVSHKKFIPTFKLIILEIKQHVFGFHRSCQSDSGSSSKEKWTHTTEESYLQQLLFLATRPGYVGFSAPSQGVVTTLYVVFIISGRIFLANGDER